MEAEGEEVKRFVPCIECGADVVVYRYRTGGFPARVRCPECRDIAAGRVPVRLTEPQELQSRKRFFRLLEGFDIQERSRIGKAFKLTFRGRMG